MDLKPLQMDPLEIKPFVQVGEADVPKLLPILQKRLPYSVFAYNSVLMYPRFRDRMSFYTLHGEITETTWIVSVVVAEDYGLDYTISACQEKLSRDEAIQILSDCPLFKWGEPHLITPLEAWLTSIVFEVSVNKKGNVVEFHPARIFWMDVQDAENIEILGPEDEPSLRIQSLDVDKGVAFMTSTWKFAKPGTAVNMTRNISRNESGAVYIGGEPVCATMTMAFGMVSALHTLPEHRQKGYANLAMKFVFKELAKNGIIPATGVDIKNAGSIAFHQKLGCKMTQGLVHYVICHQSEF
ncbi:glycine N-acyltransferase-like protein 3 [Folsomia candida]|uniref:Glycine N-acyltransferase-like protein n=1 Tax=Folsomia candida TaxID=158441 RepID=A0A226DP10_FOLCA|nr:glycine N-acyltransferase-like protein 3 [Folsomia candida]OXA46830.1 Glycine N-acyltransferase-like protein 3 [Folsomia candida]